MCNLLHDFKKEVKNEKRKRTKESHGTRYERNYCVLNVNELFRIQDASKL
jgi:hypothetical protein